MNNRISEYLDDGPPNDEPPFDGWDDGDDEPPDFACATVGEVNELHEEFDTHLKDYQRTAETVRDLTRAVDWVVFGLLILGILFVVNLILAGK